MTTSIYTELLRLAFPELIVVLTAFAILATDLFVLREADAQTKLRLLAMVASVGSALACGYLLMVAPEGELLKGMLVSDALTRLVKAAILVLVIGTCLLSSDYSFSKDPGEYFAVLLFGAVGMMFLVSSEDLLMIFLSLELTSLCLYILAGFDRHNPRSAEAALKYFLFGSTAAAFTLFGLSLLYGVSGQLYLPEVAAGLCRQLSAAGMTQLDPVIVLGIVLTLVGFAFKIAAAPFHLWAPDVYQGAPVPAAAFIASCSKVASFLVLGRVLLVGMQGAEGGVTPVWSTPGWQQVLSVVATVSLLLGNLAAIVQSSIRRLLAYSAVAHAGYMLLAFFSAGPEGLTSLVFYSITYAVSTLGAFGIVALVESQAGKDDFEAFAGLSHKSPVLSLCLFVFILSLAGIPPLAGFFGKFYVFTAALNGTSGALASLWLVILAIGMSAVSLYYYLRVLKYVYVLSPNEPAIALPRHVWTRIVVLFCAAITLLLGCLPHLLLKPLTDAIRLSGF